MTLNILFFSITINKRKEDPEKALHHEMADKLYEQNKDLKISMHRIM